MDVPMCRQLAAYDFSLYLECLFHILLLAFTVWFLQTHLMKLMAPGTKILGITCFSLNSDFLNFCFKYLQVNIPQVTDK